MNSNGLHTFLLLLFPSNCDLWCYFLMFLVFFFIRFRFLFPHGYHVNLAFFEFWLVGAIHAWVTAVKFTSFSAISNSWRTGHALKCSSTHTDTIFRFYFLFFIWTKFGGLKKKEKKKAYLMIGYLFSRFRHVMSTLASRPMTPVVGRLPSSFTSLSRKEKPSLPGPLTRLGQHTAAKRRGGGL